MQPTMFQFQRCFGIPAIRPDEALSGWIIVASSAHRIPPADLLRIWKYPIRNAYEADFSRRLPPLSAMASLSLVPPTALARTHLTSQTVLGDPHYACFSRRADGSPIQRYCPRCLACEDLPYLRLKWRLDYQFICEKHHCLLLDQCPACEKLIEQSKFSVRRTRASMQALFGACPHCRSSLARAPRIRPLPVVMERLVSAQNFVHRLVMNPVFQHRTAGTVASAKILHSFMLEADSDDEETRRYLGLNYRRVFLNHAVDVESVLHRYRYSPQHIKKT